MSFLTDSNYFSGCSSMLHDGVELTSVQKQKRKFLYLEGLIRFLEMYATNEIGNVEVNIEKCSLYINSSEFENVDLYNITDINSVYKHLEEELLNNIPLFRFLNLSDYQKSIFEKEHHDLLMQSYEIDCAKYPCLKCIWYVYEQTPLGVLSKCNLPKEEITGKVFWNRRAGVHYISRHTRCKYVTTIDNKEEFINTYKDNIQISSHKRAFLRNVEQAAKNYIRKINNLDNSNIPPYIPEEDSIDLAIKTDTLEDLGRVFNNKMPKEELKTNLRKAIFLECMIKFVEIYAQTELGSDYCADISKIAEYVENNIYDLSFISIENAYKIIEDKIIDGFNVKSFCKCKNEV